MKITIEGTPKMTVNCTPQEMAETVIEIQNRQNKENYNRLTEKLDSRVNELFEKIYYGNK